MKRLLFLFILFSVIFYSYAQEVQFPPSVLAAGGGTVNNNSGHISKWRIGRVNVLYIDSKDLKNASTIVFAGNNDLLGVEWKIQAYPNPVKDFVHIQFEIDKPTHFKIDVTDLSGRKLIIEKTQLIIPNEIVELNLSNLSSALYIINVKSTDMSINKILKISKR